MIVSRMTTDTTALTSGSCCPRRIAPKIHSGRVFCAPAVNTVTMTSSKDRREREQRAGDQRGRRQRQRDETQRLPAARAEVHGRLGQ